MLALALAGAPLPGLQLAQVSWLPRSPSPARHRPKRVCCGALAPGLHAGLRPLVCLHWPLLEPLQRPESRICRYAHPLGSLLAFLPLLHLLSPGAGARGGPLPFQTGSLVPAPVRITKPKTHAHLLSGNGFWQRGVVPSTSPLPPRPPPPPSMLQGHPLSWVQKPGSLAFIPDDSEQLSGLQSLVEQRSRLRPGCHCITVQLCSALPSAPSCFPRPSINLLLTNVLSVSFWGTPPNT